MIVPLHQASLPSLFSGQVMSLNLPYVTVQTDQAGVVHATLADGIVFQPELGDVVLCVADSTMVYIIQLLKKNATQWLITKPGQVQWALDQLSIHTRHYSLEVERTAVHRSESWYQQADQTVVMTNKLLINN